MRTRHLLHLAGAVCIAAAGLSTTVQAQNVGFRYHITPKQGAAAGFEAAIKEHVAFRAANGDTWTWAILEYVAGAKLGTYLAISNGHSYADRDAYDGVDAEALFGMHFGATVLPLVESMNLRFNITDTIIRNPPPSPANLFAVTTYYVKPSETAAFDEALAAFHAAVIEENYPAYFTVNRPAWGGTGGRVNIVGQMENWAGMDPRVPDIIQLMISHYGQDRATEVFEQFLGSYSHSEEYLLRARPDLSTPPN